MIVFDNSCTDSNSKSHDLIQDDTNMNDVCNAIGVYEELQIKATNFFQYTILYFDAKDTLWLIQASEVSCLPNSNKQNCIIYTIFSEGDQVSLFTNECNNINIIDIHGTDILMLKARFNDVLGYQNNSKLFLYLISPP